MKALQTTLLILIALEHLYFLILEMFLWTTPKTMKAFGLKTKEFAEETKVLAANQGLYNGFLAAGLIYSVFMQDHNVGVFFLACIIIAGIYGAYSTGKIKLFYLQSLPALITIILTFYIL